MHPLTVLDLDAHDLLAEPNNSSMDIAWLEETTGVLMCMQTRQVEEMTLRCMKGAFKPFDIKVALLDPNATQAQWHTFKTESIPANVAHIDKTN